MSKYSFDDAEGMYPKRYELVPEDFVLLRNLNMIDIYDPEIDKYWRKSSVGNMSADRPSLVSIVSVIKRAIDDGRLVLFNPQEERVLASTMSGNFLPLPLGINEGVFPDEKLMIEVFHGETRIPHYYWTKDVSVTPNRINLSSYISWISPLTISSSDEFFIKKIV